MINVLSTWSLLDRISGPLKNIGNNVDRFGSKMKNVAKAMLPMIAASGAIVGSFVNHGIGHLLKNHDICIPECIFVNT